MTLALSAFYCKPKIEHMRDGPLCRPKPVSEADHVELLTHPRYPARVYLHVRWPDKTVYVAEWMNRAVVETALAATDLKVKTIVDKRPWSEALEKELVKGAKPWPADG